MDEKNLKKGFCPNCNGVIYYSAGETNVICPCCDCEVSPASEKGADRALNTGVAVAGLTFDNSESALVFLENFFDNYNWEEYYETTEIGVNDVSDMIETHKIKNGASATAWYLDFKALSVPVSKKIEGLGVLETKMAEKYVPGDLTDVLAVFDTYKKITDKLDANRDEIFKKLNNSIKYAEKFNLDAAQLAEIKAEYVTLEKAFDSKVKAYNKVYEVAAFQAVKATEDKKQAEVLRSQNIDAEAVYTSAVSQYNSGIYNAEALRLFEQIRGYKDSVDYIDKINVYFNYHRELLMFAGKTFMYEYRSAASFNANKPEGEEGAEKKETKPAEGEEAKANDENAAGLRLFEVVDGQKSEKPLITGIGEVITNYGNCLYYFKKGGIYCFDVVAKEETQLDKGSEVDYTINGQRFYYATRAKNAFFFRKKLEITFEELGCVKTFLKKQPQVNTRNNNYTVLMVDLKTNTVRTLVEAMVDVADYFEDSLFYIEAEENVAPPKKSFFERLFKKKVEETPVEVKTRLMVCDVNTGVCSSVLDDACQIHTVTNGKIVYSLWKPNVYNRDLHTYDLKTGVDVLVEDNILDYFQTVKNYVYYRVGTVGNAPLMRCDLEGNGRMEIMKNVVEVYMTIGNWIYFRKGSGYNSTLMKMSLDGKTFVVVTSYLKKIIKLTESYLYYIDCSNRLCVVRVDGKDNKVISGGLGGMIVVAEDCVFFSRNEQVDRYRKALSLYKMDLDGRNVKKLVFDVDKMADYDETYLYYSTVRSTRFKVTVPTGDKKKGDEVHYENHVITRYYKYNKNDKTVDNFLTLGLPHGSTSYKKGCLKKEVEAEIIFEEAPIVVNYKRQGLAEAGETTQETVENAPVNNGGLANSLTSLLNSFKKN